VPALVIAEIRVVRKREKMTLALEEKKDSPARGVTPANV
jgi:hypothetical protein